MKKSVLFGLILLLPTLALASWQIAGAPVRTPDNKPNKIVNSTPSRYRVDPRYTFYLEKGHLKDNVKHYAKKLGWQLHWHGPNYAVLNSAKFEGYSMYEVMGLVLTNYPVEAFYNTKKRIINVWPKIAKVNIG